MISFEGYAALLEEQLGRGPTGDANDFVSLAVTGETLRRAYAACDEELPAVERALAAYDAALPGWGAAAPTDLREELSEALERLRDSIDDDEPTATASELVGQVDELIQVAAAAARAGTVAAGLPDELGEIARAEVRSVAARAPHLWQAAEDRAAWLGADAQAGPYAWIDELACLAPTRLALAAGPPLFTAADERALLQGFLRRRAAEATRAAALTPSAWEIAGVRAWADELSADLAQLTAIDVWRARSLSGAVAQAAPPPPATTEAGRVRLPVVLEGGERAVLVTLIIRRRVDGAAEGPWSTSEHLRSIARRALRDAFLVAAEQMPWRLPPAPFDSFAFALEVPAHAAADVATIDGASLGAPAVAAFLSLWTGQPLPPGFIATGVVQPGAGVIHSVGGLDAKRIAARDEPGARLYLPQANLPFETSSAVDGEDLATIDTVAELVTAAALRIPTDAEYSPWLGDRSERIRLLQRMSDDVRQQRLGEHSIPGEDPWAVLADRMRVLITSLEAEDAPGQHTTRACAEARSYAALAYTHAGDLDPAALLGRAAPDDTQPIGARLLAAITALSAAIDDGDEPRRRACFDAVTELLEQSSDPDRRLLRGLALGTQGRLRMHQRDLGEAIPLLRDAVAHHDAHDPHEAPRSRIYLATAQRLAGDIDASLATLVAAKEGLEQKTARFSRAYAATTRVFLEYELARTLLAADLPSAAAATARHADRLARDLGMYWPRHGILRTLAWAQAAMGRPNAAVVDTLADLVGGAASFEVFLEEAKRGPSDDDTVN